MRELDPEIKAWRRAMRAELPPRTVRELETHLWEHIATLKGEGLPAESAFARAVERLGEPQALGREFATLSVPWVPASWSVRIIVMLIGALAIVGVLWSALRVLAGADKILYAAHHVGVGCGYFVVFGMGLVALCALVTGWRQPLERWRRRELRQTLFRMIGVSVALVMAGVLFGLMWNGENGSRVWTGSSTDLGALLVGSTSLMLLALCSVSRWSGRVLPWVVTLAIFAVQFAWYGAEARTGAVPTGWLVLSLFFTQVALVRLNYQRSTVEA